VIRLPRPETYSVSYEELRKLEKMAGIGIDDQLSPGNFLRKVVGTDRGNHDVVIAIHNKGWLLNVIKLCVPFLANGAPRNDCRSLSGGGLRRTRPIDIMLAQVPPFPKRPARGLARRRRTKKEIEKSLE
jgi:hypothetical protein